MKIYSSIRDLRGKEKLAERNKIIAQQKIKLLGKIRDQINEYDYILIQFYFVYQMRTNSSSLSPRNLRHPQQSKSQVTIFNLTKSLRNIQEQQVETLIRSKYNIQQRKFLIIDRSHGKFIDSRIVDVQKQMQASLKQSYYLPSPTKKNIQDQEFIYQPVFDIPEEDPQVDKEKFRLKKKYSSGSTKSVWQSTWKQYDKIHETFLQSIIRKQAQTYAKLLDKSSSTLPIDINYRYQDNWAALHYAAMQPCSDFMGRLINQPEININVLTDFNQTALHIAAKSNNLQNCIMLIEAKISIDKTDNDKNTALHYAAQLGYQQIAKLLLKGGASYKIKNCMGMTAIDVAVPQINHIFQPYQTKQEENPLYRNRPSHRTIVQKMLQTRHLEQNLVLANQEKKQKRDAQFWRKKNIFKLYNLIKQSKPSNKVTLSQFQFYKKIGEGAFGQVHLVKRIGFDDNLYALKAIKKDRVDGKTLYRYIKTQREILSLVDHPFIVRLRYAFQTEEYLFLVMDFCEGGDLSKLLHKRRRFTEKQVKNYACQLLLALQALHKHNIIYRDLKPENIIIDRDGHILITDFGLSKKIESIEDMNKSFCGTPAYIPLEIINKKGHNRMVDWYEFGVVLYELYVGSPPYHADTKRQLYQIVKKGIVRFSKNTPPLLKDLIKKLLAQNPENRLGFEKDAESIRQHPWFDDVNWEDVLERRLQMPKVECNLTLGDPICSKFIDIKGTKFNMPLWSFAQ